MATFQKFFPFTAALASGVHNLGTNQLTVALTSTAPVSANAVLADLVQVAYTNMSSRNVVTSSSAQAGGVYKLVLADLVITQSTTASASFRYVALYNSIPVAGNLIGFYDYGSALVLNPGESLTIDFDNVNGVLQLT